MPVWTLFVWLAVGALSGYLAGRLMGGTRPYGLLGDLGIGCAGGVVGGWLFGLLGMATTGGLIVSLFTSFIGAVLLIWLVRKFRSNNG